MRIAWFIHRYFPFRGGSENFARAMVRRWVARGNAVDVFTSDAHDLWYFTNRQYKRVAAPADEWLDGARVKRFSVRHFPGQRHLGRLLSRLPHWPTQCRFESYMPWIPGVGRVRDAYDAVVAVGFPYTLFAHAAYQTARAAGAPLVLVPFLHLATPGDPVHRHYTRPHQKRLLREADCVVVQTDIESKAVAEWGIAPARLLKLGMAVEHSEVTNGSRAALRVKLGIPPDAAVIGQLGANDQNKGTCDLVRAVERLNAGRTRADRVHLLLAGAASPAFESFAAALPSETAAWLHRLGEIADDQRRNFYAALDVFAMPSRTDSYGIVFLEAWANVLPVVAASAGGVTEVVADQERGLLVSFGDINALTLALHKLVKNRDLADRLGQAGAAFVAGEGFTWDARFERLDECVRSLVAASRPESEGPSRPHLFQRVKRSALVRPH
jgi:glycosyltransferase involved in cell wall biosynthesis